jgi:transposase
MMQDDLQRLQEENQRLSQENAALRALVAELLPLKEQVEILSQRVKQLENQKAKDSHNSHLPPSSDRFRRQPKSLRKRSGKKAGGQEGHEGNTLHLSATADEVIVHRVAVCQHCQQDLQAVAALSVERRQVIDLPPKRVVVIEHQAEGKCCPHCQQISTAPFPDHVAAPVQYSPAFGAVAVYLVQQQLLPYERACEVLQDVLGPSMTVGTLHELVQRCARELEPVEEQIKESLIDSAVLHQDETGLYVAGERWWMHTSCNEQLTHYAVHRKRGKEAMDAIGILSAFHGVSVHDGWRPYWQYACAHALCNVHLLRDLTFVEEVMQQDWAREMKDLLLEIKAAVAQAKQAGLQQMEAEQMRQWDRRYQHVLQEGVAANAPDPPPSSVKKGRRKQNAAQNLLDRLFNDQQAVLAFSTNFAVPFDNSRAERDLRMVKVQQKISGCFRSEAGAKAFCRIRGYLSSLRKQGLNLLTALEQALAGHPLFLPLSQPE